MNDIETRVRQILVDKLAVDPEQITPEANIKDDLGADSLDVIELVIALEDEFKISIPDETVFDIITVQQAFDCVADRAGGKK